VAQALEAAGVTILNTGYGWHEARIPTIVTSVPRAAFAERGGAPAQGSEDPGGGLEPHQHAGDAERLLARGDADLVSMARPFLADPDWVARRRRDRPTRSTPASPATRPASTTPSPTSAPPAWSIRAPATRPNWCTARRRAGAASPWSAPDRPACRRRRWRPSAATR
jgi:2,4-dienoyl-CoA reductase-like NADH-dependent reductase (Old Yellow Enzyme family)